MVEFLYDVPANSTLNIDNTGAFPIYIGDRNIQSGEINGYNVVSLMYSLYYEDEPKWLVMSIHDYSPNS